MPTILTRYQRRWTEIVNDPVLQDIPYKIETNERGQIVLSPHKNKHSKYQYALQKLLEAHAPEGIAPMEYAIATPNGVKSPDVVWMSPEREKEMDATGDPSTIAPEICVEVMSPTNTEAEMETKRSLYRETGAEEVWIVEEDGTIRFFTDDELDASQIAPECPNRIPS